MFQQQEISNNPEVVKLGGIIWQAILTAESIPPTAFDVAVNAPANMNMRHIIIMSLCPIPCANTSNFVPNFSLVFKAKAVAEDIKNATVIGTLEKSFVAIANPK